tara:strand:+ start:9017 stop:10459 length:1443 start_codon:yes stop_codon:yes gene_type:complete
MSEQRNINVEMLEEDSARLLEELDGVAPISEEDQQEEEEQLEIEVQQELEEFEPEGAIEDESLFIFHSNDYVIMLEDSARPLEELEVLKIVSGISTDNENDLVQLMYIDSLYGDSNRYVTVSDIDFASQYEIELYTKNKDKELKENLVKIKETVKSNKKNLLDIKKSLTEIFGHNWDIQEDFENSKYNMSLILRFPEITIKNGRAGKKTLYDLYIKVEFDENLTVTSRMQGRRGAITYSEYISGYRHSHLPSSSCSSEDMENMCGWKDFCLGNSEMSAIQRDWQVDRTSSAGEPFNIIQFELFMYQIEAYASWESLGGGPYIRMENVHNYEGVTKIHNRILNNIYGNEIKNLKEFKVSFDNSKNRFIVDLEELEAILTKMDISVDRVQKTRDGSYIYSNNASLQLILSKISEQNIKFLAEDEESNAFLFRNKPAPTYILEYNVKEDTSTAEEVVHPDLTKYFSNKLESHINHYFIKKYGK